ncbi:MAG: DNA mismatch repair endonuclease MutL, partial [Spirochaetaceae bacterium]|nr:DNA mismatch repair endonuclease MutL [Spirochaetaceae bacterium]
MATIRVLPPETARLIAAGEVIDRPASGLRELLDNAIDSGASEISVRVEGGGIGSLRVVDDGSGMDREDIELSVLPHATSKIREADDLLKVRTLGFRGEALASIAAAARVEITSATEHSRSACRLVVGPGIESRVEGIAGRRGTTVLVSSLFHDFPARRQFLKRPQAEAALCRQVFADKAMAHPAIAFRYETASGRPETFIAADFATRIASLIPDLERIRLYEIPFSGPGFAGSIVIAGPSIARSDRRHMQVFVNRRRVQEWSLLQALEFAFSGYLPGGLHPAAFLFLEVDPSQADFNIHPAKKEVRFRDPETIRRALVRAAQEFLAKLAEKDPAAASPIAQRGLELLSLEPPGHGPGLGGGPDPGRRPDSGAFRDAGSSGIATARPSWDDFDAVRERAVAEPRQAATESGGLTGAPASFRYVGRALGPFLVFELGDELWFLDQHAAHERLIYDELSSRGPDSQELLMPERIEPEDEEEDRRLAEASGSLAAAGFRIERDGGSWLVGAA